jgi:hypothetical protein
VGRGTIRRKRPGIPRSFSTTSGAWRGGIWNGRGWRARRR